jgi:hypothetical protein
MRWLTCAAARPGARLKAFLRMSIASGSRCLMHVVCARHVDVSDDEYFGSEFNRLSRKRGDGFGEAFGAYVFLADV